MVHHDCGALHPGSGRPGVRAGRILGDQSDLSVLAAASGDGSDHKRSRTPCLTARFHPRRPLVAGSGSPEPRLVGGDSAASKGTLVRAWAQRFVVGRLLVHEREEPFSYGPKPVTPVVAARSRPASRRTKEHNYQRSSHQRSDPRPRGAVGRPQR